jgi:hypothetical protein
MDDSATVRVVQGRRKLRNQLDRLAVARSPLAVHSRAKRRPNNELTRNIRNAGNLPRLVDAHDPWMVQLGRRAGLAQESLPVLGIQQRPTPRNFERNVTIQLTVARSVNSPETAATEPSNDLEPTDCLGDLRVGFRNRQFRRSLHAAEHCRALERT